jgi:tetratricopeptide (TPR) repeat protein
VSLGGFWPDYSCVRYYWYPAHSFCWYGYYPVAQEVQSDTYNYYTYNYYTTEPAATTGYISGATTVTPVNADTFADVREKLSRQQQQGPDAETTADTLFDEGVKSFEQGSYAESEEKFARAMALAPQDLILPFAYGQTLVAQGKYTQAAEILRLALQKSSPDKQGVYFPRGLYLDENTLMDQIDLLAKAAQNNPSDSDLQLLLGYQLLGIGETEKAIEPLNTAKEDSRNSAAAALLLDLAEKIRTGETQ